MESGNQTLIDKKSNRIIEIRRTYLFFKNNLERNWSLELGSVFLEGN